MKNTNEYGGYRSSKLSKVLKRLVIDENIPKCVIDFGQFWFQNYLNCAFAIDF